MYGGLENHILFEMRFPKLAAYGRVTGNNDAVGLHISGIGTPTSRLQDGVKLLHLNLIWFILAYRSVILQYIHHSLCI
jgi:hypothetical protein